MLGLILVPLVIGALVSSIWGREAAQGCFGFVGRYIAWGMVAVAVVLVPPLGVVLASGFALYLLVRYGGRFLEGCREGAAEYEHEKRMAERQREREAQTARKEAEARIAADPEATPIGAFGPPQHCRPRPDAPTALPRPPKDAHYTATPVRDGDRVGYALVEHQSGSRVFLTVGEYGRDWIGCDPPPRKPTEAPKPAAPQAPTWSAPTQPKRAMITTRPSRLRAQLGQPAVEEVARLDAERTRHLGELHHVEAALAVLDLVHEHRAFAHGPRQRGRRPPGPLPLGAKDLEQRVVRRAVHRPDGSLRHPHKVRRVEYLR